MAAGALAVCRPSAAAPTAAPADGPTTASAPTAAQEQAQSAPAQTPRASAGLKKIRVLTADFFYYAMIVPATASFNNQRQGEVYITVDKEPDGWVTKVTSRSATRTSSGPRTPSIRSLTSTILAALPCAVVFILLQKWFVRGMSEGLKF